MPEVVIVGDTHVPEREPEIPDWVKERVEAADRTIHVGDFTSPEVLATVEELAGDLTAVQGNMDPDGLDLPTTTTLDVEDVRFVVTHGTGSPDGWHDRVVARAREHPGDGTTVAVGGHIHRVVDEVHEGVPASETSGGSPRAKRSDGVRLLNPGSATGADPASETSMLTVHVDGDEFDVEVNSR